MLFIVQVPHSPHTLMNKTCNPNCKRRLSSETELFSQRLHLKYLQILPQPLIMNPHYQALSSIIKCYHINVLPRGTNMVAGKTGVRVRV